jgi:flavorubredoxin
METRIDEISRGIYRLSTHVPDIVPPAGFTFNAFLLDGEQPTLFHTGLRRMFPLNLAAVRRIMDPERLRWIMFGHYEADECGAMNEWLAVAPHAEIAHGMTGCEVSLNDMADRKPRMLEDGEVIDIGGRRLRYIDTPHVPHGWDAGVVFDETSRTLLCGDLFTHLGNGPAVTGTDIVGPSLAAEDLFYSTSIGPTIAPTIRKLADLRPDLLAVMHGSSFSGDGGGALRDLATAYEDRLRAAMPPCPVAH